MTYWPTVSEALLVPLKHVCRLNPETLPETTDPELEFDYIDIGGVTLEAGIMSRERMTFANAPSRARKPVRAGDVIVSTVRTYLKAVATINLKADGCVVSTGFAVLRPEPSIDARFLYRVVQSAPFIEAVIAASTGVSYPAINPSALGSIKIPLHDLDTQKAIAAFLDRETASIDRLIEKKERQVGLLAAKRSATIFRAVRWGVEENASLKKVDDPWLNVVPAHRRPARLRHLYRLIKRQDMPSLDVLSVYRDHGVILKSSRDDNINKTPEDLGLYQLVESGDLVINKMKAWQGSLGVSEIRGITSPDYLVYKPQGSLCGRFMHHYLRAQPMPSIYLSISNGIRTDQWRLEPRRFADIVVWLPPPKEQAAISEFIDAETAKLDKLIDNISRSCDQLRERRAALITAAVTGQIGASAQPAAAMGKPDRARFRVIVGAEIVQRNQGNLKFGRVKLQKELYLAEAHAGINELQGAYLREAAGPLDRAFVEETERGMEASAFFHASLPDIHAKNGGVTYTPLGKAGQHRAELASLLGCRVEMLRTMTDLLRDFDTRAVEAIATLYAVWNDALIDGETPDDSAIIRAVLNDWHPEKREKFTSVDLQHWLDWMKRNRLVPSGKGPRTVSTAPRDLFAS